MNHLIFRRTYYRVIHFPSTNILNFSPSIVFRDPGNQCDPGKLHQIQTVTINRTSIAFIHSFTTKIYIAPLQGDYSEALPTLAQLKEALAITHPLLIMSLE